jgi:hypothetical protein
MGGIKVLAAGNVYTLFAAGSFGVYAFRINPLENLFDCCRQFRHAKVCEITSPPYSQRRNALVSITV